MDGDKVVISVLAPADPDTKLDTNAITTLLSDKFKIKFQFQTTTFDGGPAKEKRQIAISSGDYPDMFLLIPWVDAFTKTDVQKLGKQGVAVPLEDLIKQYAPNIQKALDSNPMLKGESTTPDGQSQTNANSFGLTKFNARNRTHTEQLVRGQSRVIAVELK